VPWRGQFHSSWPRPCDCAGLRIPVLHGHIVLVFHRTLLASVDIADSDGICYEVVTTTDFCATPRSAIASSSTS
jgi:hypothetical protein